MRIVLALLLFHGIYGDLYTQNDPVNILTVNNISTIYNSQYAWIVEFYMSWCGHCQNFAPTWVEFAAEIEDWNNTIQVGTLDCADAENAETCHEFVVQGVPAVRLLPPNASSNNTGLPSRARTVQGLKNAVIGFLTNLQIANKDDSVIPNLLDYDESMESGSKLLSIAPPEADVAILVTENDMSSSGRETILDLSNLKNVYIRRRGLKSTKTSEAHTEFIWRKGRESHIIIDSSLGNLTEEIKETLGIVEIEDSTKLDIFDTTLAPVISTNQVYLVDIENAISYALSQEPYTYGKPITDESLNALRNFVSVLVKYLPSRPPVHKFLVKLETYLEGKTLVEPQDITAIIESFGNGSSSYPPMQEWMGCKGSNDKYRGYPCGLWTTFHTLTVNAVLKDGSEPSYEPAEVLEAIHGYVKHFFSCRHCSNHFQEMYALDAKQYVQTPEDGIMWLWKGHNKVNDRLKDDITEDPRYPKIQFPDPSNCPECWINEQFNEDQVLNYLNQIYSANNISLDGVADLENTSNNSELIVQGSLEQSQTMFDWLFSYFY